MPFDTYPGPGNAPKAVGAGATEPLPFAQRAGTSADPNYQTEMFLRVAVFAGTTASFGLVAGNGPVAPVNTFFNAVTTSTGDYVADVLPLRAEPNGVFQIRIGFAGAAPAGIGWQLRITNPDAVTREFVVVVADNVAETQQPWVDVAAPATLVYDLLIGEQVTQSVHVANKGTGSVTVNGLTPALPAGLAVTSGSATLAPSGTTDITVRFTSPGPGSVSLSATPTLDTSPPDPSAGATPGHNNRVSVTAVAGALEVALLLDTSGSMGWDARGNFLPANAPNARLSELIDATGHFLDKLAHFGSGRGRFGIARFPQAAPGNPASFDVVPMQAIPAQSGIGPAQAAVAGLTAVNGTPMGDGLDRVLGSATSYFGGDQGNRRWLVLMSDGAHNSGAHSPLEFIAPPLGTASPAASLAGRRIRLSAVGYGIKGFSNVDPVLLKNLQLGSFNGGTTNGGDIYAVDQNGITATQLAAALASTIKAGLTTLVGASRDPDAVFLVGQGEARHDIPVSRHDGRSAFAINWNTPDRNRLRLELLTPTCERITPENAGEGRFAGVTFRAGGRYQGYYVDPDFLRGPEGTRFGTWTMVVTVPAIIGVAGEPAEPARPAEAAEAGEAAEVGEAAVRGLYERYTFDVLMESTLLLRPSPDRGVYFAGDPIGVTAALSVDGLPVTGATVVLSTTEPRQSFANWLAALEVPAEALAEAERRLDGQDRTPVLVKSVGAQIAGLSFDPGTQPGSFVMTDPAGTGRYRATVPASGVPEHRILYVTAVGALPDGEAFRREAQTSVEVLVRPEARFTVLSVRQTAPGAATVTVFPRDRFGNVIVTEPGTAGSLRITARGAEPAGPLAGGLDGSYRQDLRFPPGATPAVGFEFQGDEVLPVTPVPSLPDLHYVDEVVDFAPGPVLKANTHADPKDVLGAVVGKPDDVFVALGAAGRLVVSIRESVILATDDGDVTVFVHDDGDRRGYRVEALDVWHRRWRPLGDSIGVTQTFSLRAAGLRATFCLRVVDTSGRIRSADGTLLSAPGACLAGIGVSRVRPARFLGRLCRCCHALPSIPGLPRLPGLPGKRRPAG